MQLVECLIKELKTNDKNPRQIRDKKFNFLVDSLLVFPKMLSKYREIIVDEQKVILCGNMRFRALNEILKIKQDDLIDRISTIPDFSKYRSDKERTEIVNYWLKWIQDPIVQVKIADDLSEYEKQELLIKDNAEFGEWDFDELYNCWDADDLVGWGIDTPTQWADENLTFNKDELENDLRSKSEEEEEDPLATKFLQWGKKKIQLSNDEVDTLNDLYDRYSKKYSTLLGFALMLTKNAKIED